MSGKGNPRKATVKEALRRFKKREGVYCINFDKAVAINSKHGSYLQTKSSHQLRASNSELWRSGNESTPSFLFFTWLWCLKRSGSDLLCFTGKKTWEGGLDQRGRLGGIYQRWQECGVWTWIWFVPKFSYVKLETTSRNSGWRFCWSKMNQVDGIKAQSGITFKAVLLLQRSSLRWLEISMFHFLRDQEEKISEGIFEMLCQIEHFCIGSKVNWLGNTI